MHRLNVYHRDNLCFNALSVNSLYFNNQYVFSQNDFFDNDNLPRTTDKLINIELITHHHKANNSYLLGGLYVF